jgi:hypothetical protein
VYDIIRERFKDTKGMLDFLYKFLIEAKNLEKYKNISLIVRIYRKMTAVGPVIREPAAAVLSTRGTKLVKRNMPALKSPGLS